MHMADALLSPAVGAAFWVASGATLAGCARRVRHAEQDHLVPLMGVLGAFVFAAQMINFTIPATGSSGHLGGGLLLSILLGPYAAFIVIASVLSVQALFFADGGLLALGTNIFNLGVLPCFVGYLLVYRPLVGTAPSTRRINAVTVFAAVISLQLGALGVVLQTSSSGISSLPVSSFLWFMLPIHLAIGLVEGFATAAVVHFMRRARPDLFAPVPTANPTGAVRSLKPLLAALGLAAALTAGILSWFASSRPDGLEWSLAHASGSESLPAPASELHAVLAGLQRKIAWLPDYQWRTPEETHVPVSGSNQPAGWPAADPATTAAGLVGGAVTLGAVLLFGFLLRRRRGKS